MIKSRRRRKRTTMKRKRLLLLVPWVSLLNMLLSSHVHLGLPSEPVLFDGHLTKGKRVEKFPGRYWCIREPQYESNWTLTLLSVKDFRTINEPADIISNKAKRLLEGLLSRQLSVLWIRRENCSQSKWIISEEALSFQERTEYEMTK
jgi:hypothetical protein